MVVLLHIVSFATVEKVFHRKQSLGKLLLVTHEDFVTVGISSQEGGAGRSIIRKMPSAVCVLGDEN